LGVQQSEDSRQRAGRLLGQAIPGVLAGVTVLVPLCFSPHFLEYGTPKLAISQALAVLLLALWVSRMALEGEVAVVDTPLLYTFVAFLAASFVSLFQAYNVLHGLATLFEYGCYFSIVVVAVHTLRRARHHRMLAGAMALTGSVVAFLGLLQHNGVLELYARWSLPLSTIGNVNFVAEYYDVVFPLVLVMVFVYRSPWLRAACVLACFLMACHLVVLGSRGGWLGAVVSLATVGGLVLVRHFHVGRRALDVTFASLVVVGLGWPVAGGLLSGIHVAPERTLGALAQDYWERIALRTEDAMRLRDNSSRQRVLLWEDTLRLVLDRPLVGVGVGNFEHSIPGYMSRESLEVKQRMEGSSGQELMAFRAHNEYLEVWAETGILGFGVFCLLIWQVGRAAWLLVGQYLRGEADLLVVGLSAAFLATLAHAFFSTNLQDPASAVHFWLVVGMIWSLKLKAEGETRLGLLTTRGRRAASVVIATVTLATLVVLVYETRVLAGEYHYQRGSRLLAKGEYSQAAVHLLEATKHTASKPFHVHQALGYARHRQERWAEAIQAFRRSLQYHPNNATVHYHLGLALGELGEAPQALPHFRRAAELNPLSGRFQLAYGETLGNTGDPESAQEVLREALRLKADADVHHAMGMNLVRVGELEQAIHHFEEALAMKPGHSGIRNSLGVACVRLGVADGDPARLATARDVFRALSREHPADASYAVNLAIALLNLGEPGPALEACSRAIEANPDFARSYAVIGSIYEGVGDRDGARAAYLEGLARDPEDASIKAQLSALDERQ